VLAYQGAAADRAAGRQEQRPAVGKAGTPEAGKDRPARADVFGDPLPAGALVRMGTPQLRHDHPPGQLPTAFSPDGKTLASNGWEEIRLWDLTTGRLLREIRDGNRTKSYCSLLFTADGRWLAGTGRESVCIWEVATGRLLREFPAGGLAIACSPDGQRLATSSKDGSVSVWDMATGQQTAHLRPAQSIPTHAIAFTADGKGLVTMADKRISHWDLAEGKLRKAVEMPIPPYFYQALSLDGQTLAVTPRDAPIALWDTTTGKERLRLQGELAIGGFGIAFSPDGKTLATNGNNPYKQDDQTTVAFWDATTGQLLRHFRLPTLAATAFRFAPDGRTLLTTGYEPIIRLWDVATGKPAFQWPAHTQEVSSLAFTPGGRSLVSGSLDGAVRLWEVSSGRQVRELAGHRWRCDVVAVTPDGKSVLSGGADGCIRVQGQDGTPLRRILLDWPPEKMAKWGHHINAIAVTPDGKTAATWSKIFDGSPPVYHLWDLATGEASVTRPAPSPVISTPHFSPDARLVLEDVYEKRADGPAPAAGAGKVIPGLPGGPPPGMPTFAGMRLCEVATGREVFRLRHPDEAGGPCAFTPDGRTLLTVTHRQERTNDGWRHDSALHVWEVATGKERQTLTFGPSSSWFQRAAFAPEGRTLATARNDGAIQLWDLSTGKELPFRAASGVEVSCLAFSPDARLLATGHRDGIIFVWDAASAVGQDKRQGGKADSGQLEQWWADLASEDARRAYAAICGLSAGGQRALRLFRDRLRPVAEGPPDQLRPLIADLDSPQFQQREAARKRLMAFGEQAGPAPRAALKAGPSAEQRRRIEAILDALNGAPSGEALRHLRAVEVLELIGTDEARRVVETLANGAPEARLTREAQVTLQRLTRRPATMP
jgi:WD40 repeat protein